MFRKIEGGKSIPTLFTSQCANAGFGVSVASLPLGGSGEGTLVEAYG